MNLFLNDVSLLIKVFYGERQLFITEKQINLGDFFIPEDLAHEKNIHNYSLKKHFL